ncbi:MAG: class I SAM-dependent methyltransferase [Deltaproteobacteria bacterium]|nr:class I SAM-dependent methyltransferase [Deltaproteobacteria bacterium]
MVEAKRLEGEKSQTYYHHSQQEMLRFVPQGISTILDIGCGAGEFGHTLKTERNAEVWGIELVPDVARKAANKLDRVSAGNIETDEISLPDGYFDGIVFNDVLEHLVDPWQVLRRLRPKLRENGVIVASIPNMRHFHVLKELIIHKQWEYKDQGVLDRTHLRFFTVKGVKDLFETSGYRVVTLEGIDRCDFSWKFKLLNGVLLNRLEDTRYSKFACVARVNSDI